MQKNRIFSNYDIFIIAVLTFVQFTIILDFIIISPLGAILLKEMNLTASQFGMVVSGYAISAGISGILAAGFADKFDRKKMLLFFYSGFVVGTFLCAKAPDFTMLFAARIFTGIFGGVLGAINFAIVTDLFKPEVRGRVMGFLQTAFALSQVLGVPIGLYLANEYGWHSTFLMIVGLCIPVGVLIMIYMKPVDDHLKLKNEKGAVQHLIHTAKESSYLRGYLATILLATGGFMMMPFASAYAVNNLGIAFDKLPALYIIVGLASIIVAPLLGKLTDTIGKFQLFMAGSILTIIVINIYCNLGITPFWGVTIVSITMFVGITSRMISYSALVSEIPEPKDRGAFMSINGSIQQISGGIATYVAGLVIFQTPTGVLENYPYLGIISGTSMIVCIILIYNLDQQLKRKKQKQMAE
jgi:predicted MFS family arabinose efflux permease